MNMQIISESQSAKTVHQIYIFVYLDIKDNVLNSFSIEIEDAFFLHAYCQKQLLNNSFNQKLKTSGKKIGKLK